MIEIDYKYLDESEIPTINEILSGRGLYDLESNKVLIKIHKAAEVTKGGIILADITKENESYNMVVGMIIGMGPDCYKTGPYIDSNAKPRNVGDWVIFSYKSPNRMNYEGIPIAFVFDDQIFGRVDDPTKIKRG